jgi:hypothetical protein
MTSAEGESPDEMTHRHLASLECLITSAVGAESESNNDRLRPL